MDDDFFQGYQFESGSPTGAGDRSTLNSSGSVPEKKTAKSDGNQSPPEDLASPVDTVSARSADAVSAPPVGDRSTSKPPGGVNKRNVKFDSKIAESPTVAGDRSTLNSSGSVHEKKTAKSDGNQSLPEALASPVDTGSARSADAVSAPPVGDRSTSKPPGGVHKTNVKFDSKIAESPTGAGDCSTLNSSGSVHEKKTAKSDGNQTLPEALAPPVDTVSARSADSVSAPPVGDRSTSKPPGAVRKRNVKFDGKIAESLPEASAPPIYNVPTISTAIIPALSGDLPTRNPLPTLNPLGGDSTEMSKMMNRKGKSIPADNTGPAISTKMNTLTKGKKNQVVDDNSLLLQPEQGNTAPSNPLALPLPVEDDKATVNKYFKAGEGKRRICTFCDREYARKTNAKCLINHLIKSHTSCVILAKGNTVEHPEGNTVEHLEAAPTVTNEHAQSNAGQKGKSASVCGGPTIHCIRIDRGQDVIAEIRGFVPPGLHFQVLSAVGDVISVSLGSNMTYQGNYSIVHLQSNNEGSSFDVSVSTRGTCQLVGGRVSGPIIASGPVDVSLRLFSD